MLYSGCFNVSNSSTGTPAIDYKAAQNSFFRVMEFGLQMTVATASQYGIGRSGNTPTQTLTTVLLAEDAGNTVPSQTTMAQTWTTTPTVPTQFERRFYLAGNIGQGIVFTWPRGYSISPAAASFVLWNSAANCNNVNTWLVEDE